MMVLRNFSRFAYLLFALCCFVPLTAHAQWLGDSTFEAKIQKGIDNIYDMKLDQARSDFRDVIRIKPDHPAGHFFLAMVEWWRILIDIDDESHDEEFIGMLENVVTLCDKRLDKDENDLVALFFKGGSLGFRGRIHANRGDWIKAANDGRIAMPIVQQAYSLAPKNYDILLGIGIYNYYAEVVPEQYPIVKPVMIFFPKGDKEKGIHQLLIAAEKAKYARWEAAYFLVQLYQNYEKQPQQALPIVKSLHERFPNNPIFEKYLGRVYTSLGEWDNIETVFKSIHERARAKRPGYTPGTEREAEYYLGLAAMQRREYEKALQHLYRCDEMSRTLDVKYSSGFMAMANLRIGMIYDKQGKRQLALDQYKKVLKLDDYQNSHDQARGFARNPYNK